MKYANDVLALDSGNEKAKFRKGVILMETGDLDGAKLLLMSAARADPKNKGIRKSLEALKQKTDAMKKKERELYQGKI